MGGRRPKLPEAVCLVMFSPVLALSSLWDAVEERWGDRGQAVLAAVSVALALAVASLAGLE